MMLFSCKVMMGVQKEKKIHHIFPVSVGNTSYSCVCGLNPTRSQFWSLDMIANWPFSTAAQTQRTWVVDIIYCFYLSKRVSFVLRRISSLCSNSKTMWFVPTNLDLKSFCCSGNLWPWLQMCEDFPDEIQLSASRPLISFSPDMSRTHGSARSHPTPKQQKDHHKHFKTNTSIGNPEKVRRNG